MSGYWSAIAAAARGGAGGQGDAAPVPLVPLFAPEAGGQEDVWGAIDIESAATKPSEPQTVAPPRERAVAPAAGEGPVAPTHARAPVAAAALPPVAMTPFEADEIESEAALSPVRAEPAETVVAVEQATAMPVPWAPEPPSIGVAGASIPPVAAVPAEAMLTVPAGEGDSDAADDDGDRAPAIAEAAPVGVLVEAMPVAAAGIETGTLDSAAVDGSADLPPPIHIHIDRIDIRLTEGDRAPAHSARGQVAPVVALDEFLRRSSERNG